MDTKKYYIPFLTQFKLPRAFTKTVYHNLFKSVFRARNDDDIKVYVTQGSFKEESSFNTFLHRFKGNDVFNYHPEATENDKKLSLTEDVVKFFLAAIKRETQKNILQQQNEEQVENEDRELFGCTLLQDSKHTELYKDYLNTIDSYYIADEDMNTDTLELVNNKENGFFKFLPNPEIKEMKFTKENTHTIFNINRKVVKVRVKIEKMLDSSATTELATHYLSRCPECGEEIPARRVDLNIKYQHICGETKKTILRHTFTTNLFIKFFFYEATIMIGDNPSGEKITLYTRENNIRPGVYECEILCQHTTPSIHGGSKEEHMMIILTKKEIKPEKPDHELIPRTEKTEIRNIMIGIRKIYEEYVDEKITNKGELLQLAVVLSGVMKIIFNNPKYAISVIGNQSLSKTYVATRFAIMFDPLYHFSHNAMAITIPGLTGGSNNKKNINGVQMSMFEAGVVTTAGICVLDEAENFYVNPQMNAMLKSLPEKTLQMDKVGAKGKVEQNYTPIILCNFMEHNNKYQDLILKTYIELLEAENPINKEEEQMKIQDVDLYRDLCYYYKELNNTELGDSVAYARRFYELQRVDWRTGGRVEPQNRILLDFLVNNKEKTLAEHGIESLDNSYTSLIQVDTNFLPTEEFQEELLERYKDSLKFDLFDIKTKNNGHLPQVITLLENVKEWLMTDMNLHNNFAHGKSSIDPKLRNYIYHLCMGAQLLQDPTSTKLSPEVKEEMMMLLMKCKRGITEEEYDYEKHILTYDETNLNIRNVKTDLAKATVEKIKGAAMKEAREAQINKDEADDVDDYIAKNINN